MRRKFNVTGTCIPEEDYMVDISGKIEKIVQMIDNKEYFTINRARQYGKTTTLVMLKRTLQDRYIVLNLSFEGVGDRAFKSDVAFALFFINKVGKLLKRSSHVSEVQISEWQDTDELLQNEYLDAFDYLSEKITNLCGESEQDIILMIDEVDRSSDNRIFLHFLGMLRNKYLARKAGEDETFKSVILAGVYDIKNLKLKIRPDEERKYNSPWNVAADFKVDMSFSVDEIAGMLEDYEKDNHTGMDIDEVSKELYECTGGYPSLVSRLCKWIDEEGNKDWTLSNLKFAQKELLKERNTLLDDLIKNIENHKELKQLILNLLYDGKTVGFNLANPIIELGVMFGIFKEKNQMVVVSNRFFETYLYDYTISIMEFRISSDNSERSKFIKNNRLDMQRVLLKFQEIMKSEYRKEDEKFMEKQGRLLFLCFLKPIINGTGFYYVETETRNSTRMDIVLSYGGEEHIIELKIWRGEKYRKDGIKQLEGYMESRGAEKGYLISFSFVEEKEYRNGWIGKEETTREIFEVVV